MEDKYPKIQWSRFIGSNRDEQWVVRGETIEEVKRLREQILADEETRRAQFTNTAPLEYCPFPEHKGITLKEGRSKSTGKPYFYHRSEDGLMCFGEGFRPKRT